MCSTDIFLGFLAILFPPLPVWVKSGICSADSFINLLLCVLGFLPGLLHAWYIIAKNPTPPFDYDGAAAYDANESGAVRGEGGQRIYVFVHDQNGNQTGGRHHHHQQIANKKQPGRQGNMNYGTTTNTSGGQQHAPQDSGIAHAGPSSGGDNAAPPPSYAQVVAGDHKVQTQD